MDLPAGLLARLGQGLQEIMAIHIIQEDVLLSVSPAHHMTDGTGILNARLAWHEVSVPGSGKLIKINEACYGLTPLGESKQVACQKTFLAKE